VLDNERLTHEKFFKKSVDLFLLGNFRSLSVHDCVRIDEDWYQCASVGWTKVNNEYVDELEKKVVEHPMFKLHGP